MGVESILALELLEPASTSGQMNYSDYQELLKPQKLIANERQGFSLPKNVSMPGNVEIESYLRMAEKKSNLFLKLENSQLYTNTYNTENETNNNNDDFSANSANNITAATASGVDGIENIISEASSNFDLFG